MYTIALILHSWIRWFALIAVVGVVLAAIRGKVEGGQSVADRWGAFAMMRPGYMRSQWDRLLPMMESGVIDPPIGRVYPLDEVTDALVEMDDRRTLGKSVVRL